MTCFHLPELQQISNELNSTETILDATNNKSRLRNLAQQQQNLFRRKNNPINNVENWRNFRLGENHSCFKTDEERMSN